GGRGGGGGGGGPWAGRGTWLSSPPAEEVRTTAGRGGLLARGRRPAAPSRPFRASGVMPSASPLTVAGAAPDCSPASLVSAGGDSSAPAGDSASPLRKPEPEPCESAERPYGSKNRPCFSRR